VSGSRQDASETTREVELRAAEEAVMEELRRARTTEARRPDFFIVGHAKCGTTALYNMLKAHPQVYMPSVKEPEFLSRAPEHHAHRASLPEKRLPDTLERYLALFEGAAPGQLAGEASTEYLRTLSTARRIAELQPDARIIAMFREPTSFLRSLHLQLLQVGVETEPDFERAIALEDDRRQGRRIPRGCSWPPALLYSEHVRYRDQLRQYHEHFGRERVLALIYDDFLADNAAVVRRVLRFLGVDDSFEIEATKANPTLRVRSQRGERLVNAVSVGKGPLSRPVKRALKTVLPERARRHAKRAAVHMVIETEPKPPAEEFMAALRRRYKGEVVAASEDLDRNLLGLWGYDGLA
jgi:hypothetical protein